MTMAEWDPTLAVPGLPLAFSNGALATVEYDALLSGA